MLVSRGVNYLATRHCGCYATYQIQGKQSSIVPQFVLFSLSFVQSTIPFFLSLSLFQGMIYIHNSKLSFHGRLKSSNSLVDNRWMLKITDYGVARFQGSEETNTLEEQQIYKSTYSRDPIFRHTLEPRIVVFNSESVLIPKPV